MKRDATFVSANVRSRKNCIGSIGADARSSQTTKAATSSAPATIGTTMPALVQPCSFPRTSPHTIPRSPVLASASPAVRLLEARVGERGEHEPDRDVHPEDPVPRDPIHDRAADERAERHRE